MKSLGFRGLVIGGFRVSGSGFKRCRGFFGIQGFRDLGIKLSGLELSRSGLLSFGAALGLRVWGLAQGASRSF